MAKKASRYGYGKPPESGKFKKGQSGNSKGRPKGAIGIWKMILKQSREKVRVKGPDGMKTMTKLEAALMQLANKAAQGDIRAQQELFSLVQQAEEATTSSAPISTPHEFDRRTMKSILRRFRDVKADQPDANQEPKEGESN